MMNGSSFATGSFPKTSGFYGNTFWTPPQGTGNTIPSGNSAGGTAQDYVDPVFTEDYQVLATLNNYYSGQLLLVKSLFATAPTVAYLLGLSMPQADGRVLNEALATPASKSTPTVVSSTVTPTSPETGLRFELPNDPTGATADTSLTGGSYNINLGVKDLTVDGKTYRYFDYAKAIRQ